METRMLGRLWPVSALTLGGGGVGQLWGPTTRDECIATVRTAVDCGITLLDMAPAYGNGEAESVVGAAFDGRLPAGIRVTTKHRLGTPPAGEVEGNIVRSLDESLARMRLERVDLFFLHSNIIPDDYDASRLRRPSRNALDDLHRALHPGLRKARCRRAHRRLGHHRHRHSRMYPGRARRVVPSSRGTMHHEPDRLTGRAQILRRAEPRPRDHRRQQERGRRRARHPSGTGWSAHRHARPRFAAGSWRRHGLQTQRCFPRARPRARHVGGGARPPLCVVDGRRRHGRARLQEPQRGSRMRRRCRGWSARARHHGDGSTPPSRS